MGSVHIILARITSRIPYVAGANFLRFLYTLSFPASSNMTSSFPRSAAKSSGQSSPDKSSKTQDQEEKDLVKILSFSQRVELIRLVGTIMQSMLETICSHADAPELEVEQREVEKSPTGDEDVGSPTSSVQTSQSKSPKKLKKAPTILEAKSEAEATRFFCDWSDSVLLRLQEVLGPSKSDSQEQHIDISSNDVTTETPQDPSNQPPAHYPPLETSLRQLSKETKILTIRSLLLILLSLKHYNSHSRVLLVRVTSSLGLSERDSDEQEAQLARVLLDSVKHLTADEEAKARVDKSKISRRWKVGLASVAGAALIGVTGGLAAPLVAASLGAVMGGLGLGATVAAGYLGAVAGSSVIIGGIFGAYGAKMSGRMMDRYAKEVEDFAFIPTHSRGEELETESNDSDLVQSDHRLRVTIGISGWLTEEDDIVEPWRVLGFDSDVFALRWEFSTLVRLGNALTSIVRSAAWTVATRQVLAGTVLASLMSAVMWPVGLMKVAHIVDNPFSVAKSRADKAGEVLADALVNRAQGERPVTLIGYSLGARVIFACIRSLAKRRAFGLIESAVLIGSPTPSTSSDWRIMRSVVSGRLINVYSVNDSVLGFVYRTHNIQRGIAGLQPIKKLSGVENVDVSDSVSGHLRYQYMVGTILQQIGISRIDKHELRSQIDTLKAKDKEDADTAQHESEQSESIADQSDAGKDRIDHEVHRLEDEVEERTQEALFHAKLHSIKLEDETYPQSTYH